MMTHRRAATLLTCLGALAGPVVGRVVAGSPTPQGLSRRLTSGYSTGLEMAQGKPADSIINVQRHGARGDGVANDTMAIRIAIRARKAAGSGILYLPPGTYLTDALNCRGIEDLTILGEGELSTLKRRTFSGTALLSVGNGATVCNLRLDGNKASAVGSPSIGDRGLVTAKDCLIDRVISVENYGHGFRADGDRNHFLDCVSQDNGLNPGDDGTADGYYVRDPGADNVFENCSANGNARSGFVITDLAAGCCRNQILSCTTDGGNGYNEVNLEGSTDSIVRDCAIKGLVTLNRAVHPYLFENTITDGASSQACIYGRDTVESHLAGNWIETSNCHERIHVEGIAPRVEHNSIRHSSPPSRGYSIFVSGSDATDAAVVVGNLVYGGRRGIYVTGASQFYDNRMDRLADVARSLSIVNVNGRIVSTCLNVADVEIRDSQGIFVNAAPPVTGSFLSGDVCRDPASDDGEESVWVCVAGGSPGVWAVASP